MPKTVALEIAIPGPRPRLREDKVATRVLRDIENALTPHVPGNKAIILTLGAPIKVPNRLVAALTELLLTYLKTARQEADEKRTILGNRVRFRIVRLPSKCPTNVLGFVFTGDPSPGNIASVVRALLNIPQKKRRDHWLIVRDRNCFLDSRTYQCLITRIIPPGQFQKIILVNNRGRAETLAEI